MADSGASVDAREAGGELVIGLKGAWTVRSIAALDPKMAAIKAGSARLARFDLSGLDVVDSAGAWLIARTRGALVAAGLEVKLEAEDPHKKALIDKVLAAGLPEPHRRLPHHYMVDILARTGKALIEAIKLARDLLGFFGSLVIGFLRLFVQPRRIRFVSLISHIEHTGLNALPIIGLISFLIGIVLAYEGADQLRKFGAEVFTVNMVGVLVLREMGILLTSIIVAGRTGSAFTAQIGTMQVNEEVDALRTLGLDPLDVLVLPRMLALMISLPLLVFFSDILALLGGGFACVLLLNLSVQQYLTQLQNAVSMTHFLVGLSKAPIFAAIIAVVGCFEGLRVTGSAESVGRLTTKSVVESLFLVIVFDAFFSVLFSYLHV